MTLAMLVSLFTAPVYAYVGAMTKNTGGITAGQKDGYYYLTNDYIGFYIRPGGNLTTVPSQKTLADVKSIGATETHVFYKQTKGNDSWSTDFNTAVGASSSSVTIDTAYPTNPKLKQILTVPSFGATVTIIYELVRLDAGAATGTVGTIVGHDASDDGTTWGVLASASGSFTSSNIQALWTTTHNNFGSVAHSLQGTVRLDRFTTGSPTTYYSAPISSGLSRSDASSISEVYTDSFSYANQFVAMHGYANAIGYSWDGTGWVPSLISGISGHLHNYASTVTYSTASGSQLSIEHKFSGDKEAYALWGFRNLYATADSGNIPADPVSISTDATCVGIIKNNATVSAVAGANEAALKSSMAASWSRFFAARSSSNPGILFLRTVRRSFPLRSLPHGPKAAVFFPSPRTGR